MTELLRLEQIKTRLKGREIHRDVSFSLRAGEIMGLIGASGSGKSVLLRVIIGLLPKEQGKIFINNQLLDGSATADDLIRRQCGVMFQDGALFSGMNLLENIEAPLKLHTSLSATQRRELAMIKLGLAGLNAGEVAMKMPAELSGGMRKRAALARALALDPPLLLLDEPTAGLDPITAAAFDELLLALREALGLGVLLITHDLDSLVRVTDRISCIQQGMAITGSLAELARSDDAWLHSYFHGPRGRAAQQNNKVV